VISGRRPNSDKWATYPKFILFDGRPYENYSDEAWTHVGMVSDNFKSYTSLTNKDIGTPSVFSKLKTMVDAVHAKGKKVRLWETADTQAVWAKLKELGVDFINTDNPVALKAFLSE
jgi:alkaline phosphatase